MKRELIIGIGLLMGASAYADKVEFSTLPAAAQKTVNDHRQGAVIEDIDRETKDGRTFYEVTFKRDGKNVDLRVNPDGTLIQDTDKKGVLGNVDVKLPDLGGRKMQLSELPVAVQNTIRSHSNGAPIEDIDRETKDGRTIYEVAFKRDGKNTELKVAEDGSVIRDDNNKLSLNLGKNESRVEFSQLPAAVRKTIQSQAGAAKIADLDRETRDGRVVYEVEFERQGRNTEIVVAEDGTLLKQQTPRAGFVSRSRTDVSRLPMAVQNSIRQHSAGGAVADIDEETRDGRRVYEVEFQREGKNNELVFAEDGSILTESSGGQATVLGRIQSNKVTLNQLPAAAQRTVRAHSGGAVIEDIDREEKDGRVVYEVHFKREGKNNEIRVGEDGSLIKD